MLTLNIETDFDFEYSYTHGEAPTYDYPGSSPEISITKIRLNGVVIPIRCLTDEQEQVMIEFALNNHL